MWKTNDSSVEDMHILTEPPPRPHSLARAPRSYFRMLAIIIIINFIKCMLMKLGLVMQDKTLLQILRAALHSNEGV